MSLQLRKRALGLLLSWLEDGVLLWGSLIIVADQIGVSCSTISKLWRQAHGAHEQSLIITPEITSRNNSSSNCLKYSHTEFRQGLKEIRRCRRKTYRSTAKAMGVALSTVQQMLLHRDVCRVHMSSLKPTLTEENKMSRMELALSFIDKNNTSKFENMEDLIHINEKWFYRTKDGQHFIIAADSGGTLQACSTQVLLDKDHVPMCSGKAKVRHEEKRMVRREDWNLAYQEMGAAKRSSKMKACVEEPMHYTGCLL